ncbi:MAG: ABC transporter ATP-binding protein [Proteobacteria bacterium]|nr:ABC transporter ATP-binding protein [Pseudomonadota bacterium]
MTHSIPNKSTDIVIQNLTLRYQNKLLFDQFNMVLPEGKWTVLLGASGIGKSTLLKSIAGLPTGVENKMTSKNIFASDGDPITGRISYMAQQDLLMPWLTVLENCLLGYRMRGQAIGLEQLNQATDLLRQAGLKGLETSKIQILSGGMRQRVSLIRTLLDQKPFVLMDEPFSALDSITRLNIQDLAVKWLRAKTVLMVTHDPLEALRISDRIYILLGQPAQLLEYRMPESALPRQLADTQLLKAQAELLNLLSSNSGSARKFPGVDPEFWPSRNC